MTDEPFHCGVKGQPMIVPDRWYIGNTMGLVIVVDQPGVGFKTEGECTMYIKNMGPQHMTSVGQFGGKTDTSRLVAVPSEDIIP